ncbi:hypothetical protein KQI84_03860 [bacterium]|nr:hypothetical protein [bacterium]
MSEKTPKPKSFRPWARFSAGELLLLLIAAAAFFYCLRFQVHRYEGYTRGSGVYVQEVRLPATEIIRFVALGYDDLYADFLVLQAVQAFGSKWQTPNNDNTPILEYFDTVTELAPHWIEAYELGNLVLTEGKGDYDLSFDLLRKGIRKNPNNWRLPFLAIYNAVWGMNEPSVAREFLHYVKRIPDAPGYVIRMEEYIERQSGRFHAAFNVNLSYYLRYLHSNRETEANLAIIRFKTILDGWYKLELARAADAYYKEHGEHPPNIEALLDEKYRPDFTAPTMTGLLNAVEEYSTKGEDIRDFQDDIREESIEHIVGLPPDPNGTWYYLSSLQRSQMPEGAPPEDADLVVKYPYFSSIFDQHERVDARILQAQNTVAQTIRNENRLPEPSELARFLGPDWVGGHMVYDPSGPYFYSTAMWRVRHGNDPRIGLSGTLENFPRRTFRVSDDQPDYLQAEPTLWDFEEDAVWAEDIGLTPGVPYQDQPPEVMDGIGERIVKECFNAWFVGPMYPPPEE